MRLTDFFMIMQDLCAGRAAVLCVPRRKGHEEKRIVTDKRLEVSEYC